MIPPAPQLDIAVLSPAGLSLVGRSDDPNGERPSRCGSPTHGKRLCVRCACVCILRLPPNQPKKEYGLQGTLHGVVRSRILVYSPVWMVPLTKNNGLESWGSYCTIGVRVRDLQCLVSYGLHGWSACAGAGLPSRSHSGQLNIFHGESVTYFCYITALVPTCTYHFSIIFRSSVNIFPTKKGVLFFVLLCYEKCLKKTGKWPEI